MLIVAKAILEHTSLKFRFYFGLVFSIFGAILGYYIYLNLTKKPDRKNELLDLPPRHIKLADEAANSDIGDNGVCTSKYTIWSFGPKNLLE